MLSMAYFTRQVSGVCEKNPLRTRLFELYVNRGKFGVNMSKSYGFTMHYIILLIGDSFKLH